MLGGFFTEIGVREYKGFKLFDELPTGWRFDKNAGSPLCGYSFATDGKSVLRGGKRALVRVAPPQKLLFDVEVVCSKMETTTPRQDESQKPAPVVDAQYARTVNDLARAKFVRKLLADILVDLTICEIEGWCKREYLNQLVELINGIGRQPDVPPNAEVTRRPVRAGLVDQRVRRLLIRRPT